MTMSDPDYSPEMAGRLAKLETAISKGRTVKFAYWSIARDTERERTVNPLALLHDMSAWYVVGEDLEDESRRKKFRVSRIRSDIRFATRRERDFRFPGDFDIDDYRGKPPWQVGELTGTARVEVHGDTAWWVARTLPNAGTLEEGVFETPYASVEPLASWVLRQNGRAVPLEPVELRQAVSAALERLVERHTGDPPRPARARPRADDPAIAPERLPGPVAPERFGVLQALLAHLLAACGEGKEAELDAEEVARTFSISLEELEEALSLLNLVNFGGGCYTVYAELNDGVVRVDKELYGDVFRRPPKLTPLEARAIRLALEFVGPMIAADSRTPLEKVRGKLEETFGQFELTQTPEPHVETDEERLVATLSDAMEHRRVVRIAYQKEDEVEPTVREVEPYQFVRELPHWYVHTWDRDADGPRTFRLDRMRSAEATGEDYEARPDFDPSYLRDPRVARIHYAKPIARWKVERGAQPLAGDTAVADVPYATEDWLLTEILGDRGEATVLEPAPLRATIAKRARQLARELRAPRRKSAAKTAARR